MQLKSITSQSSKIFYRITGKGKPVVLIHGFGEDGNIWDKQVEFLKDQFTLIIPDLPGSGKSSVLSSQLAARLPDGQVGIEDYAEVMNAILVEERIKQCSMIGHSMGGYITLAFAEKYPRLLSSFGLIHSSAFADSEEKKAARLKSIEFINKHGAFEFMKATIQGLFSEYWSKDHQPEIDALIEKSKNFTAEAIIQYYRAMINRPGRTAVLENFSHPILFISGELDKAVPFTQSMQQSHLPNLSYITILRNSAHMGMWEETGKVNTSLLDFLTGQPG
jgi:pimeloyl-ACP methyl ester carboxylesterase